MSLDEFYNICHSECSGSEDLIQQTVFEFFNLQSTPENINLIESKVKYLIVKRKDKFNDWKKYHNVESQKEKFSSVALERGEFPDQKPAVVEKAKPPKRPTRDFSQVGSRQKRRKLPDLNSQLDEFANDNNISVNQ
ncbi:unnamed protein product, partial [Didymodactylos carnosus]